MLPADLKTLTASASRYDVTNVMLQQIGAGLLKRHVIALVVQGLTNERN